MLKVLKEKPWSYVLMVDGERALLTILMNYGGAENDMTIELSDEEKADILSDLDGAELLVCRSVNSLTHIGYNEAIDQQK